MSFQEELIITIVDKLAIGLLIVAAGFVVNIVLAKYKSERAFIAEIAKTRVTKISEVLSLLYEREALLDDCITMTSKVKLIEAGKADVQDYEYGVEKLKKLIELKSKESQAKKKEIQVLLEQNRFWLQEQLYEKYQDWENNLALQVKHFVEIFVSKDDSAQRLASKQLMEVRSNIKRSKEDIAKILKIVT